jgi:hypothetical protein
MGKLLLQLLQHAHVQKVDFIVHFYEQNMKAHCTQ